MMRLLSTCLLLTFCAVSVQAAGTATITRIDPGAIQPVDTGGVATLQTGCVVGNNSPAYWLVTDWFHGQTDFWFLVDPGTECTECPNGFKLTGVHILMRFEASMVPTSFPMTADLWTVAPDGDCWQRNVPECVSLSYTIPIQFAGDYDVSIPLECDCLASPQGGGPFFVGVHFPTAMTADLWLSEGGGTPCRAFANWGEGWQDLSGVFGDYGDVSIFANLECCEAPVETDGSSWGAIKGLYR